MSGKAKTDAGIALDIVEHSPSVALRISGDDGLGKILFATRNISAFGYEREDFLRGDKAWPDLVHPDDLPRLTGLPDAYAKLGVDVYSLTYRVLPREGKSMWVRDNRTVTRGEDGRVLYSDCIIQDNTIAVESEARTRENLLRQQALNDILQALYATEADTAFRFILRRAGEYLDLNRVMLFRDGDGHERCSAVCEWTAKGTPSAIGEDGLVLDYGSELAVVRDGLEESGMCIVDCGRDGQRAPAAVRCGVKAAACFAVHTADTRYGFICFDDCRGERRWESETLSFLKTVAGLVSAALTRQANEDSVRRLAYHNQLTGLLNRYRFDEYLSAAVAEAAAKRAEGYALFIDMDDFKIINDGYGHAYGDALLVCVARWLESQLGGIARLFHFGGDEFMVLLGCDAAHRFQEVLDNILTRARHPWQLRDHEFYCTVSIGVVRFPDGDDGASEVVKNADIAMYQAKGLGKNSYVLYNRGLNDHSLARAETESRMRATIANDCEGFEVHYQPIVDISGAVTGAEALVRWRGSDGRMMPPGEFIGLAEYLGLIIPLGEFVLREAALQCRLLNESQPGFTMHVNVSIRQFQQHDFTQRVHTILRQTGVNAGSMVLEVTEGMAAQDAQRMKDVLCELRALGVRVAMDDFGTGYSSLNNMRQLPLDIIKIDRSFIRDVDTDAYSQSFVRLICDLCHTMGRTVCVEGVESARQYDYCVTYRADQIQGFYFYRPMPAGALHLLAAGEGVNPANYSENPP